MAILVQQGMVRQVTEEVGVGILSVPARRARGHAWSHAAFNDKLHD